MRLKTKEIIYMILDELKLSSNDAYYTRAHILFLIDKWRAFLIKQRYSDIRKHIPEEYYQSINLDIKETSSDLLACMSTTYMKSTKTIPTLIYIGNPKVTSIDYFRGEFNLISKERLRYIGHNKYLKDMIYCAIDNDKKLTFISNSLQLKYLSKVLFTAIFSSFKEVFNYLDTTEDIEEVEFPIETALVPALIELVVKELSNSIYRPEDDINNSSDNFGKMNVSDGDKK